MANLWGNAAILDALALRDGQDVAAQAGRTIIYVEGTGSTRQVKIRYPDGTTADLPGTGGEPTDPVTSLAGSAVSLDPASFGGNLPVSIEDVQALADTVDNLTLGTSVQLPPVVYLSASTESTTPGGAVTLFWNTDQTTVLSFNQGIGVVTPVASGSMVVNPLVTTHYRAIASGAGGAPDTSSVFVVVSGAAPDLPVIDSFSIDDASVPPGGSTNLRWMTTDATEVEITADISGESPAGDLSLDGSVEVTPGEAVIYTLTARNSAMVSVEATVSVSITHPRTTTARRLFAADPANDRLFEIDPDGSDGQGTFRALPGDLEGPIGMANYGFRLLVSDHTGAELWSLDPDGGGGEGNELRNLPSDVTSPQFVVVYQGRVIVYTQEGSGNNLYEVYPHGATSQFILLRNFSFGSFAYIGAAVYNERFILLGADERLFELDPDGNDSQGEELRSLPPEILGGNGLTVHDGRLLVASGFGGTLPSLWEVDPDGADDEGTELRGYPSTFAGASALASIPPLNSDASPVVNVFSYVRNGTSVTFSWETTFSDEVRLQIGSSDNPASYIDFVTALDPGGTHVQVIGESSGLYWRVRAINENGPITYSDGLIP